MPPTLFTRLRHWWARLQGGAPAAGTAAPQLRGPSDDAAHTAANPTPPVPYDEALLASAGLQQLGRAEEAKALTRQALDWGCSPRLVRQILISGVHNSSANFADEARFLLALKLFEQGRIASGKAGRLCHTGRVEFLLAASRAGVPVMDLKGEELAQEFS